MAWAGFSEEELQMLQQSNDSSKQGQSRMTSSRGRKSASATKSRPQRAVQPIKHSTEPSVSDCPVEARLSSKPSPKPPNAVLTSLPSNAAANKLSDDSGSHATAAPVVSVAPAPNSSVDPVMTSPTDAAITSPSVKPLELLTDSDGVNRELNSLQQYQQQQKMMEELNKKKKQMLAKALAERTKQASAETTKLKTIQRELSHLDQILNVDVSLIRDRIEEATRLYSEASRRYEQAEKEYVEAKINLHKKSELKEQLTEHLYTIIHQNEIRKAKKLAELMEQLEMTGPSDASLTPDLPDLPSYSLLGNLQSVGSGNLAPHKTLPSPTSQINPIPSPPANNPADGNSPASSDISTTAASVSTDTEPTDSTTEPTSRESDSVVPSTEKQEPAST